MPARRAAVEPHVLVGRRGQLGRDERSVGTERHVVAPHGQDVGAVQVAQVVERAARGQPELVRVDEEHPVHAERPADLEVDPVPDLVRVFRRRMHDPDIAPPLRVREHIERPVGRAVVLDDDLADPDPPQVLDRRGQDIDVVLRREERPEPHRVVGSTRSDSSAFTASGGGPVPA